MRVRQEAVRKASRPIVVAQVAAVLVALGVAGTAGWLGWSWIGQEPAAVDLMKMSAQAMASPLARSLVVAILALAVVTPVVFYVVLSDE
jgi:multidrug efflux pump subunit AcrB